MPTKNTQIKEARKKVENFFGAELAKKASNEFCLSLGEDTGGSSESMTDDSSNINRKATVILELTGNASLKNKIEENTEKILRQEEWTRLQKNVEKLTEFNGELMFRSTQLLRYAKIKAVRDNFYQSVGHIYNELERRAGNGNAIIQEMNAQLAGGPATEICWLNRTIRTKAAPELLSEIAGDKNISLIDLPRRLNAEILTTAQTIGATSYRTKFKIQGKGIVVAVIDSEVYFDHPALNGRVTHQKNYTKESWGNPGAHGTAVAGIIAANNEVYNGIAPEAMIYNYKVLAENKSLNADDFGGALAIQQALEDGAHIANCSWGAGAAGDGTSREARACNEAWALGMSIVKSAGNQGAKRKSLTTPADADGIIVVGATDSKGVSVQDYSSRGPTPKGKCRPHLVAPGGTFAEGIVSCSINGDFIDCGCGTSYAAPHVAGLLALILEANPELLPDEQRNLLLKNCLEFDQNDQNIHGYGLISIR